MYKNITWIIAWAIRMDIKFGPPESGYDWCRKLAYANNEAGADHPSSKAIALAKKWESAKFANVYCSQCGADFGPGDHGYSHCENHKRVPTDNKNLG